MANGLSFRTEFRGPGSPGSLGVGSTRRGLETARQAEQLTQTQQIGLQATSDQARIDSLVRGAVLLKQIRDPQQKTEFIRGRIAELDANQIPSGDTREILALAEAGDFDAVEELTDQAISLGQRQARGQKKVQSTRDTEGGTLITFTDGTQEFRPIGQEVITAEQQAAQRDLPKLNSALQTKSVNLQQEANDSFSLSEKSANLSKRFAAADIVGGTSAEVSEAFSRVVGGQDALSSLRQEFTRIRNKLITQNLPQGPATDRDIELIAEGFPKGTANKQQITEFLDAMSRGQEALAKFSEFQSAFLIENGNITRATRDFEFDGQQVKKGERLNSAYKRVSKALTSKADELSPEEQAELAQLEQQFRGQ